MIRPVEALVTCSRWFYQDKSLSGALSPSHQSREAVEKAQLGKS